MKTAKDILTENRDSVISSIKYVFRVWRREDIKTKMIEFLAFAEENMNMEAFEASKRVKSDLKFLIQKMAIRQEKNKNIKTYGTENPKLADIMGKITEKHEEEGKVWHPIYKTWVKKENSFSSMSYNPKFI